MISSSERTAIVRPSAPEAREARSAAEVGPGSRMRGRRQIIHAAGKISHPDNNDSVVDRLLANEVAKTTAPRPPPGGGEFDPLVRRAGTRGITLLRMPAGMQRRLSNTTKFNKRTGTITWKIELRFHVPRRTLAAAQDERASSSSSSSPPKILGVECESVVESSTLSEELGRHLDVRPHNSATRSRLREFANAPRDALVLLVKRLPCSSADPRYYRLDPNVPLTESLRGKTIIEFPTIDVVLDEDKGLYPLFIGEVH
ncbi:hypothetical protein ACHAW5_010425 [Stephanodiscus triporus]|uniref:BCD1 alpha/beta domain-containing protein n=1 Tax=Stephanodiscus triporus TaxID=2934178 RepID=A0ABD3PA38_9STRA